jgi:hypothetical protein
VLETVERVLQEEAWKTLQEEGTAAKAAFLARFGDVRVQSQEQISVDLADFFDVMSGGQATASASGAQSSGRLPCSYQSPG